MTLYVNALEAGERLGEDIQKICLDWNVPGMAIAVVNDMDVIWESAYGYRDVESKLPVTIDTLFPIASATKSFTAFALALLVQDGKLSWDTPVKEYIPYFEMFDPVATERATIRDLACHRSGLTRHDLFWYNASLTREQFVKKLRFLEFGKDNFRTTFQYTNIMYAVLGHVVEIVSGQTWEEFVYNKILTPLQMTNSNFTIEESLSSQDFSLPYRVEGGHIVPMDFYPEKKYRVTAPAGSINSSVGDMSRWLMVHLGKGNCRGQYILSEELVREMHTPHIVCPTSGVPEKPMRAYGLGWFCEMYRGVRVIHHGGNINGFSALVSFIPQENIGVVALANRYSAPVAEIAIQRVYDELLGLAPIDWSSRYREIANKANVTANPVRERRSRQKLRTAPSHTLDCYAGVYEHPAYGQFQVLYENGILQAVFHDLPMTLEHFHYDVFELGYAPLGIVTSTIFHTNIFGDIDHVSIRLEGEIIFARV